MFTFRALATVAALSSTALSSCSALEGFDGLSSSSTNNTSTVPSSTAEVAPGTGLDTPAPAPAPDNQGNNGGVVSNQADVLVSPHLDGNTVLTVDACDLSGDRQPNAKVDIGFGDRVYWGYTNEVGQLVEITAQNITPQNEPKEMLKGGGKRYCRDEAKVPGTELKEYDEGHGIADSLGGVSNAYNITPQASYLNRYGAQRDMEREIAAAGGATNFHMVISYPDENTSIPTQYDTTYTTLDGVEHNASYANVG